jgi:MerR, DNA binding
MSITDRTPARTARVVFVSALYDLVVTAPFATPWTMTPTLALLERIHHALGLRGSVPELTQPLGFSLEELRAMLKLSERRTLVTSDIARAGNAKLAEIDARIADLGRVREALGGLLSAQCIEPDQPCPIIQALDPGSPTITVPRARSGRSGPSLPPRSRGPIALLEPGARRRKKSA